MVRRCGTAPSTRRGWPVQNRDPSARRGRTPRCAASGTERRCSSNASAVDRLVGDPHGVIIGMMDPQPVRDPLRVPRIRPPDVLAPPTDRRPRAARLMISERAAEVEDRAGPGHREGGPDFGTGRSAISTVVERTARSTPAHPPPRMHRHGLGPRINNGPLHRPVTTPGECAMRSPRRWRRRPADCTAHRPGTAARTRTRTDFSGSTPGKAPIRSGGTTGPPGRRRDARRQTRKPLQ